MRATTRIGETIADWAGEGLAAIVAFARAAAAGTDGPDGYGFSTRLGTALPPAVTQPDGPASRLLLWTAASGSSDTATFVSTIDDYYAAERSDAAALGRADRLPAAGGRSPAGSSWRPRPMARGRRRSR